MFEIMLVAVISSAIFIVKKMGNLYSDSYNGNYRINNQW